jgi:hypothetical protein
VTTDRHRHAVERELETVELVVGIVELVEQLIAGLAVVGPVHPPRKSSRCWSAPTVQAYSVVAPIIVCGTKKTSPPGWPPSQSSVASGGGFSGVRAQRPVGVVPGPFPVGLPADRLVRWDDLPHGVVRIGPLTLGEDSWSEGGGQCRCESQAGC